ncbi:MAG TPA: sialate O-acetylesterase, partial [Blastocatellia bacterium]|nr:sialate O-acetylesterase [Blastocatellia bacterium]
MRQAFSFFLMVMCFFIAGQQCQARADVHVPSVIGDNMVVQQGRKVRIWGTADPGEPVTVSIDAAPFSKRGSSGERTTADSKGSWQVLIGPLAAGGPFELTVAGKNTLTFKNILVGEVWICSGQSNMEFPLAGSDGAAQAIAQANYPEIRLFTVQRNTSREPLDDVKGQWEVTSPKTVERFSAVAYYFGRELYQRLKVPIGLIHTSWGGTEAEAWTSPSALANSAPLKPILERYENDLANLPQRQRAFQKALAAWSEQNEYSDSGNKGEGLGYADPKLSVDDWRNMDLPQYWESAGLALDGAIWFRRELDLPEAWAGHDLSLDLGPIDDWDTTYFNGVRVGGIGGEALNAYEIPRHYHIPGSLVHAGRNVVAVRVFDRGGNGGFGGSSGQMYISMEGAQKQASIPINGPWRYKIELGLTPKAPDYSTYPVLPPGGGNPNSPSVLYN